MHDIHISTLSDGSTCLTVTEEAGYVRMLFFARTSEPRSCSRPPPKSLTSPITLTRWTTTTTSTLSPSGTSYGPVLSNTCWVVGSGQPAKNREGFFC